MGRDLLHYMLYELGQDFNPLSPHGERPRLTLMEAVELLISIHSPRMGRDSRRRRSRRP